MNLSGNYMELEKIILNEVKQNQTDKCHVFFPYLKLLALSACIHIYSTSGLCIEVRKLVRDHRERFKVRSVESSDYHFLFHNSPLSWNGEG